MMEHTGIRKASERRRLASMDGLVEFLDTVAERKECRLRRHSMESFVEELSWIKGIMPEDLSIDPEQPVIEETLYELISQDKNGLFAKGLLFLNDLWLNQTAEQIAKRKPVEAHIEAGQEAISKPGSPLWYQGVFRWFILAGIGLLIGGIIWALVEK